MESPRFYFVTCQNGSEKAVKAEILASFPELKFAFSRPGFITFKAASPVDDAEIEGFDGIFSRLFGSVLGQAKNIADKKADAKTLIESIPDGSNLHVFERETFAPGDEPESFEGNVNIKKVISEFQNVIQQKKFRVNASVRNLDVVYDLMWVDDFHVFLGSHRHRFGLDPTLENSWTVPKNAPSRAYLKIEEAIRRFDPDHNAEKNGEPMQVLEIGCSPGGASRALLDRKFQVVGVDPKNVDEGISDHPQFRLIQKTAKNVTASDLQGINPQWIVMDMNLAPLEALDELAHIVNCLRKNLGHKMKLKQGLLTIKLNDWSFAESTPLYLKRIQEIGFQELTAKQLNSNRQEFFVMATKFKI